MQYSNDINYAFSVLAIENNMTALRKFSITLSDVIAACTQIGVSRNLVKTHINLPEIVIALLSPLLLLRIPPMQGAQYVQLTN